VKSTFILKADYNDLSKSVQFVSEYASKNNVPLSDVQELELAVEEVLANIIKYAYPDEKGDIEVDCDKSLDKELVVTISDTGVPFDISLVPEPALSTGIVGRKDGGIGLYLARQFVDKISYHRENGRNISTLVKRTYQ